jgi:hypothetical protein
MDLGLEGVSPPTRPPFPCRHPGGDPGLPSLFPHPQLLTVGAVHFLSRHVPGQDNPPVVRCEHTQHPAQEHERVEKLKFEQTTKTGSERTHPGAIDPFPQGDRVGLRIPIGPMS